MPRKNLPDLGVCNLLKFFQLKSNELAIYDQLTRRPMTIKQLQKTTRMSERSLRTHLDDLVDKEFVHRKVVEDAHLKYLYYAAPGENLLALFRRRIDDLEHNRIKSRNAIIQGTQEDLGR